jgi:phosphatidylethanolamine/phosphatidyl-N-methylethanolamine N-methyltransferase
MPLKTIASMARFSGEFIANPKPVGSLVPSSRALSRCMAGFIPVTPEGYVVELGAGTGAITSALLKHGIPPERLIAVDCSLTMVRHLRERYPHLKVLMGSAARLKRLLAEHIDLENESVRYIVSGLPLRSLPKPEVTKIAQEVARVLEPGGRFIQFTYDLRHRPHPALADFEHVDSAVVWFNFPPARVNVYLRRS